MTGTESQKPRPRGRSVPKKDATSATQSSAVTESALATVASAALSSSTATSSGQATEQPWQFDAAGNLNAPVQLPRRSSIAVKLADVNLLKPLNKFQRDFQIALTVFGIVLGVVFGIVLSGVGPTEWKIVYPMTLMLGVFVVLTILSVVWMIYCGYFVHEAKKEIDDSIKIYSRPGPPSRSP